MDRAADERIRKMHPVVAEFISRHEAMRRAGEESRLEDGMNALAKLLHESGGRIPEREIRELVRIGAIMVGALSRG